MNKHTFWTLSCALALLCGCAVTQQAALREVTRTTYVHKTATDQQREEFYVVWSGENISLVKFEYRQVKFPNEVFAKAYVPTKRHATVFEVGGDEFQKGGKVSAWRVTLWRDKQPIAERKSALW